MYIALVTPASKGGVLTTSKKLYHGLKREGFKVDLLTFSGKAGLVSEYFSEFLRSRLFSYYDLVLYTGTIPRPGHIVAKLHDVPVVLFVHGFLRQEILSGLRTSTHISKRGVASALIQLAMFEFARSINTVDLYVCCSFTTCEANNITDNFVLLPQYIFPEEYHNLNIAPQGETDKIKLVAYTSYALSPRLMNKTSLLILAKKLEKIVKRRFEFIIVDPLSPPRMEGPVRIIKPMPQEKFLSLLASAHLYLERCIDEEIGYAAIEAMALGTPVAKITHPKFWERQDYGEEEVILARSFNELVHRIADYIEHLDHYYPYYSKGAKKFVFTKRTWDATKGSFLASLKKLT